MARLQRGRDGDSTGDFVLLRVEPCRKMGTRYILGAKMGYPIQIRTPDLHTICNISNRLKGQWRSAFEKMHGNLLQILEIETQPEALEALIQVVVLPSRLDTLLGHHSPTAKIFRGGNNQSQEKLQWNRRPPKSLLGTTLGPLLDRGGLARIQGCSWVANIWGPTISPTRELRRPCGFGSIFGQEKQRRESRHGGRGIPENHKA
ncbi:hypothetical protein CR513_09351, partial [Mucuna pruriens]